MIEIVLALEYLHSMDIVYGAVHPINIIYDGNHIKLITDFCVRNYNKYFIDEYNDMILYGFLRSECHLYIPMDVMSILREWYNNIGDKQFKCDAFDYWSPEMVQSDGKYNEKTNDFWAMGVLFYVSFMKNGRSPFSASTVRGVKKNIIEKQVFPDDWSFVNQHSYWDLYYSKELRDLVDRLLDKNLEARLCDWKGVKAHPAFKFIDWDKVYRKQIRRDSFDPGQSLIDHYVSEYVRYWPKYKLF